MMLMMVSVISLLVFKAGIRDPSNALTWVGEVCQKKVLQKKVQDIPFRVAFMRLQYCQSSLEAKAAKQDTVGERSSKDTSS